jgi:hypothetical protein
MNINQTMNNYVCFLNQSLPSSKIIISGLDEPEEVLYDWLQASWEMLVESALFYGFKNYLPIYGQGADLGINKSSRVSSPSATPTHKITCTSRDVAYDHLSKARIQINSFEFEEFVSLDGEWYSLNNDITHAMLSNQDMQYVVSIDDINFELVKITRTVA